MLITCFQCRQQLDVPDDSAGKRIRCPHCSYVIVAPARPRALGGEPSSEPAIGLPSMDLDGDATPAPKPAVPKAKIPAETVPPMPLPPVEAPKAKKREPMEDLPAPPSIERGARRRGPTGPAPARISGTVKVLIGLGFTGALVVGVAIGAVAMHDTRRHIQPMVGFKPIQPQPPVFQNQPFKIPVNPGFNPNFNQAPPQFQPLVWHDFQDYERRFKVAFPDTPVFKQTPIGPAFMMGHEAKNGDWVFAVLHRNMTVQDYNAATPQVHFKMVEHSLSNQLNLLCNSDQPCLLAGVHKGREWEFSTPDGRKFYARSFLIRDGEGYHHYLQTALCPANVMPNNNNRANVKHFDVHHFFNSFVPIVGFEGTNAHVGQTIYEQLDDTDAGNPRDNEFLALALHPHKPIVVATTTDSLIHVLPPQQNHQFTPGDKRGVEQAVISSDGHLLAVCTGNQVYCWSDWDTGLPRMHKSAPGRRCAFGKNQRLFVAAKNSVKAFDFANKGIANLDIKDMNLQGLAIASDDRTLAVHDDKSIAIWDWPDKKLLGHFDAHDALITSLTFSPDGKTLASTSADRTIKLWDVATRTEHASLKQHAWTTWSVAFTPDGKHLISGGLDGMFLVWDLQPEKPNLIWAQAHQFPVRGVAFDGDGKHCYLTCREPVSTPGKEGRQYRRLVRKIEWSKIGANPRQAEKIVAQCAGLHLPTCNGMPWVARPNDTIVTPSDHFPRNNPGQPAPAQPLPHVIRIWDANTARQKHHLEANFASVLSPDGKWLVYSPAGQNSTLHVLEVATRNISKQLLNAKMGQFPFAFFAHDSKSLWLAAKDEMIRFEMPAPQVPGKGVFDKVVNVTQKQRIRIKEPNAPGFLRVTPSLDQKQFLVEVSGFDAGLRKRKLFDSATGQELDIPRNAPGNRSAFLRIRFTEDEAGFVELEDVTQGRTQAVGRLAPLRQGAAVHPLGKMAAIVGSERDKLVRVHLWDLEAQKPILTVPDTFARSAFQMQFSADGSRLAWVTNAGWTRIVPTDWLLERKGLLACDPNEVAGP